MVAITVEQFIHRTNALFTVFKISCDFTIIMEEIEENLEIPFGILEESCAASVQLPQEKTKGRYQKKYEVSKSGTRGRM